MNHEKTWKKLKCISLSERGQAGKLHTVWLLPYDIMGKADLETVRDQRLLGDKQAEHGELLGGGTTLCDINSIMGCAALAAF